MMDIYYLINMDNFKRIKDLRDTIKNTQSELESILKDQDSIMRMLYIRYDTDVIQSKYKQSDICFEECEKDIFYLTSEKLRDLRIKFEVSANIFHEIHYVITIHWCDEDIRNV